MGKLKAHKKLKSHLSEEEKKLGRHHIYILIGMIVLGLIAAIYSLN